MRWRGASNTSDRLVRFSGEEKEAECFREVAGMSVVAAGGQSAVDTFNHRQPIEWL